MKSGWVSKLGMIWIAWKSKGEEVLFIFVGEIDREMARLFSLRLFSSSDSLVL